MLAYQMIYTACGKDRSGAFSVWAKSSNVTKVECDEIIKLMSYKKLKSAPYEPTEEEIKTLFPKKYGYFTLTSGRKCIAQTSYIGKVYSDLDPRNGNFLIHAYIFDDLEGFNPFGIFGLDIFKSGFSYKEWHDDPIPTDLPPVELNACISVDENTIRKYVLGSRKSEVVSFLQCVIDASNSDATITFNDTEENQMQLYSLIGALIPSSVYKKATYSNHYSTQLDYTMSNSGMSPVKLRNIFPDMINSTFNYQEELAAGHPVFYFEKGICANITPKRYLTDIIHSLESGESLFNVLKKIDAVNNIIIKTGCDIDTAIAVYYVGQKNLSWFTGSEEFSKALEIALQHHYIEEKVIAERLFNDILATEKWGKGSEILSITKFVYNYSDNIVKESILDRYFTNLRAYGVNTAADPNSVLSQVKNNAPFPWDDFVRSLVKSSKWNAYVDRLTHVGEMYFIFDAAVSAIGKNLGEIENKAGYYLLSKIFNKSVRSKSLDDVQLYLKCASKLGGNALRLVEASLDEYLRGNINDESTLDFVLRFICALDNEQEKIALLGDLIVSNMKTGFFMTTYIRFSEQHKSLFNNVESAYKNNQDFNEFLFRKDAFIFKNAANVTYELLNEYYRKYYMHGYDNGVYIGKVKQYVSTVAEKNKLSECIKLYNQMRGLSNDFADIIDIFEYLSKEIFSLSMDKLLANAPQYMNEIEELNGRLSFCGRNVHDNYPILQTVMFIREKYKNEYCLKAIQDNTLYNALKTRTQQSIYISNYFNDMLLLYCKYRRSNSIPKNVILASVFATPIISFENLKDDIIKALEGLGNKGYYDLMADIMSYAFNAGDKFAEALKRFVQYYIGTMGRGECQKLFKKIIELLPKDELAAVQSFTDKYEADHMSFFKKLFSKKK